MNNKIDIEKILALYSQILRNSKNDGNPIMTIIENFKSEMNKFEKPHNQKKNDYVNRYDNDEHDNGKAKKYNRKIAKPKY